MGQIRGLCSEDRCHWAASFLHATQVLLRMLTGQIMPKCYAPHHDSWHCHPDILMAEYGVHEYMSVAYIRTASHPAKQIGKSDAVIPAA